MPQKLAKDWDKETIEFLNCKTKPYADKTAMILSMA